MSTKLGAIASHVIFAFSISSIPFLRVLHFVFDINQLIAATFIIVVKKYCDNWFVNELIAIIKHVLTVVPIPQGILFVKKVFLYNKTYFFQNTEALERRMTKRNI